MTKVTNPVPLFLDGRGALIDAGKVYIGEPDTDPRTNPLAVFTDAAMQVAASQPLDTMGGVITSDGAPVFLFVAEDDYSLRIEDANGNLVSYTQSAAIAEPSYQPLDSDLTAIAALATTPFGRSLLTLANASTLRSTAEIVDSIPSIGGNVSGAIIRTGSGAHAYYQSASYSSFRVFGPENTTDPTSQPGDLWLKAV